MENGEWRIEHEEKEDCIQDSGRWSERRGWLVYGIGTELIRPEGKTAQLLGSSCGHWAAVQTRTDK